MDIKEGLKKYWFVAVVAILLVAFVVAYGINSVKNQDVKVTSLSHDGKDVIYTIDEDYYYADDLYKDLYETYGPQLAFTAYYKEVIDEMVPTTEELTTMATNWAAYLLQSNDEQTILSSIRQAGYNSIDDLAAYCLNSLKYDKMMIDYYDEHFEDLVKPVIEKENPRNISHILVKVANVDKSTDDQGNEVIKLNPTEEETKKLNEVLDALKTKDFADVAKEYSEDGSASEGGLLGLVYESNKTQYVKPFYEASMALKSNEVSDVVESEFGYHIIKAEVLKDEELMNNEEFVQVVRNNYPNRDLVLIQEKAKELGYKIKDEKVTNYINQFLQEAK